MSYSENPTHQKNLIAAEQARQIAYTAAGNSQAAVVTADISYHRSCLASARANSCGVQIHIDALKSLGTGGS
jgi:hypothetical protein